MDEDQAFSNAAELFARMEAHQKARAETMPDERAALRIMLEAYARLRELGFRDAIYCPKDGTVFEAVNMGCTAIARCSYLGEWPGGGWFVHEAGDLWPARPILFRPLPDEETETLGRGQ